jgi:hypothetical protein
MDNPSPCNPFIVPAGISWSGLVPREMARTFRFLSFDSLLKCAAATTLFAEPCSQTKITIGVCCMGFLALVCFFSRASALMLKTRAMTKMTLYCLNRFMFPQF